MVKLGDVTGLNEFTHGHRGQLFLGMYRGRKIIVKRERIDSPAPGSIANEICFLRVLNKKKVGPKLLFCGKKYFGYQFVTGRFFPDFLERCSSKRKVLLVVRRIFRQCFVLDHLGINKEEMHHPHKHILIDRYNVVMIDFERCRYTVDPRNVTQFSSYLLSSFIAGLLKEKGITVSRSLVIRAAQRYKQDFSKKGFDMIIDCFS